MAQNLELALKIKALVDGAKNVQGLAGDVQKLQGQAKTPIGDPTQPLQDGLKKTGGLVDDLVQSMAGLLTLGAISGFVRSSIAEFNKAEAGFRGLEAVANRSGVGIGRAMQEAELLAADGLISVQDAQKALQNLLSRGYDISQATGTIAALKDSAVTGRAAHLSLAEAVVTATEGLRNENSILVDNAGVTKNVSILWKEYAASIGKSVTELTQQEKVQAEVNGILRETAAFTGQAADAANTLQGQMAKLTVENQKARAEMGQALMPVMLELTRVGVGLIENFFKPTIFFAQRAGIKISEFGANFSAFVRLIKSRDLAAYRDEVRANRQLAEEMSVEAAAKLNAGLQFTPNPLAGGTAGSTPTAPVKTDKAAAKKAADEARRIALAELGLKLELTEQAARLEQDLIERQIAANKQAFDEKTIDAREYYTVLSEFQRQQGDSEIRLLEAQRAAAQAAGGGKAEQLKAKAEVARINTDIELVERRVAQQQVDNAAARVKANIDTVKSVQALIDSIEQEAFTLGLTNDERARAIALLELEKLAAGLTAEEYNKLRDALNAALDSREAAETRKVALEDAKKQAEDIRTALTENLQRSIADVLNNGFTGDGARGAIKGFVDLIRTSLSNVIAANLTDSILNSFSSETLTGVGKFLGLGGKRDGSSKNSAIYVQDVATATLPKGLPTVGSADGGTDGIGGMFGGFFETIKGLFSSLAGGLSGLFSGLVKSLSGLFSGGGGGGGGGGGSNVGGWVSAIASLFGYAEGGYTGAGGKYQPAGVVHRGEWVNTAAEVNYFGLPFFNTLRKMARGTAAPTMPRLSYADGGLVNLPGSAPPTVNANTKVVNMFDLDSALSEYLNTRGGERSILNVIQRNPGAVGA